MKIIKLTKGKRALIDNADYELVSKYKWHAIVSSSTFYATNDKVGRMHRLILGITDPKIFVDHIDGSGGNNRRSNIRICTNSDNQKNKKPIGTSKYLGVNLRKYTGDGIYRNGRRKGLPKPDRWIAKIKANGKYLYIGIFKNERRAAKAYDEAAKKHHGEFANLNFK